MVLILLHLIRIKYIRFIYLGKNIKVLIMLYGIWLVNFMYQLINIDRLKIMSVNEVIYRKYLEQGNCFLLIKMKRAKYNDVIGIVARISFLFNIQACWKYCISILKHFDELKMLIYKFILFVQHDIDIVQMSSNYPNNCYFCWN